MEMKEVSLIPDREIFSMWKTWVWNYFCAIKKYRLHQKCYQLTEQGWEKGADLSNFGKQCFGRKPEGQTQMERYINNYNYIYKHGWVFIYMYFLDLPMERA